jgi:hypothetical protein
MTRRDAERVERLLRADLAYDPEVEERYGEASRERMRALRRRLSDARKAAVGGFPAI